MSDRATSVADGSARPLWQQVFEDLERQIGNGELSGRFPTDRELAESYGVSRHTVREAVRRLRARGLVDRHRGRGSIVTNDRVTQPVGGLYSIFQAVERQGLSQRSEVLSAGAVRDPSAAGRLNLPPRAELVRIERLRYAGDEPLAVDAVWLPVDVGRPLLDTDLTHTSLYEQLRDRVGVVMDAVDESLEPVVAGDEERDLLRLEPGEALFRIRRLGRSGGRPIECRLTLIRGQRFLFTSSWRAGSYASEPNAFVATDRSPQ